MFLHLKKIFKKIDTFNFIQIDQAALVFSFYLRPGGSESAWRSGLVVPGHRAGPASWGRTARSLLRLPTPRTQPSRVPGVLGSSEASPGVFWTASGPGLGGLSRAHPPSPAWHLWPPGLALPAGQGCPKHAACALSQLPNKGAL